MSSFLIRTPVHLNRSFSRRIGKSLSATQKDLLEFNLPAHLYDKDTLGTFVAGKPLILEVGFGMGDHFINQAKLNPHSIFIGAEPYLNGVANALKLAKDQGISNFLLWSDDLDIILSDMPDNILAGIYILFPDPWPKTKQLKKRILNIERLGIFKKKLKDGGFLVFASDIDSYFEMVKKLIVSDKSFQLADDDFTRPHANYITTKYHQKSIDEGRTARFLKYRFNENSAK